MSTLEPHGAPGTLDQLARQATGISAGGSPVAGLADASFLQKLAAEYFSAFPQSNPQFSGGPAGGPTTIPSEDAEIARLAAIALGVTATGQQAAQPSPRPAGNRSGAPASSSTGASLPSSAIPEPSHELPVHNGLTGIDSGRSIGPVLVPLDAEIRSLFDSPAPAATQAPGASTPQGFGSQGLYFTEFPNGPFSRDLQPPAASLPVPAEYGFDVNAVRRDFPILEERVNGRQLIWFDNAATTQKPRPVIERLTYFYEHENSNIHRAAHELAARSTDAYEGARNKIARFLNASSSDEIVFTRGATEAINLVAATYGAQHVGAGDEIVITHLEHHANVVPWQQLALAKGAKLRVAPVDDRGALLLDEFGKLLNGRTKLVAVTQVSNALGTITPVKEIIAAAHRAGARVLVDGAQSVSHLAVDVQDLDADFFVFSGHKIFAPTGIGVLYGKKDLLNSLPPYQTGGNMIRDVTIERSEFHSAPARFEAGTGNIADAVGLGAAIDYVQRIGLHNIARYEHSLLEYATHKLLAIPGLKIIGQAPEKASVISLTLEGYQPEEVGQRLNKYGIAVRSGHHCAQPILRRFGLEASVRPSFAFYNTCGEIDVLVNALEELTLERGTARVR